MVPSTGDSLKIRFDDRTPVHKYSPSKARSLVSDVGAGIMFTILYNKLVCL